MGARRYVGSGIAALALAFVMGPQVRLTLEPAALEVPEALEAAAAAFEARDRAFGDVTPEAEARVVWGGEPGAVTDWSVLYLHGFSATRQELAPLPAQVARALGATLIEARLTGHGRSGEALASATAQDWLRDTRQALGLARAAGRRTLLIGCSTGGTLAAALAAVDRPEGVTYALLSPNFGPKDAASGLLLWPWARTWVPWVAGRERSWTPASEAQGRYWTTRYPIEALFPMMALVEAVRNADVTGVRGRWLVYADPRDPVVDVRATEAWLARLDGAEIARGEVRGPGDFHVIAGDILSAARTGTIAAEIVDFARAPAR